MELNTVEQLEEVIIEHFKRENVSTIVLVGKPGIGKTWMARKLSLRAVKENLFDIVLWIYLSVNHDEKVLYGNIARQLSLLSNFRESEIDEDEEVEENADKEENLETLRERVLERLSGRRLLLILDGERKKMHKKEIEKLLTFLQKNKIKKLVTSVNEDGSHKSTDTKSVIDMKPLNREKSLSLLRKKSGEEVFKIPGAMTLVEDFIERNMDLTPAEIGMIGKLLSYHQNDFGVQGLKQVLEEVKDDVKCNYLQLLCCKYDKVPCDILVDFSWHGNHIFRDSAIVHYSELISYWIMEGYLGQIDCIDAAFEEGHHILMELLDCGVLKKVDVDHLIMQKEDLNLDNFHPRGFCRTATLGLANVLVDGCSWDVLGKVLAADGMIRSVGSDGKGKKQSTLLLDGNRLQREDIAHFLDPSEELKTLGVFHPILEELSLPNMINLSVLLLRNCESLENINCIKELRTLNVLEVSGASSVKSIPEDFFSELKRIRSLNLSSLQVEVLPKSLGELTELRWLIIRRCSQLKKLPRLQKCNQLVVVDLCGATQLEFFPVKNLKLLPNLQRLDLSGTKIKFLPILSETGELTHLSLSGCAKVVRLPSIKTLHKLQVLDLSRASLKEFHDSSFQSNTNLKILDLSETAIFSLPPNIGTPCQVYLKNCNKLEYFNCVESPKNLEVLDLSGASSLTGIEARFFDHLKNLQVLNFSKTKVSVLPALSSLINLRQLLLSSCSNLQSLPSLNCLCKLEVLDLTGCKSLTVMEDESFEHMSRLKKLSLSETKVERLPELKSLLNLEELNLCGVPLLAKADFLKDMSNLRTLELSETLLEQLPPLSNLKNLSILCLSGCKQLKDLPNLEELRKLEVLDLSGTAVNYLPSLKDLSNLRKLLLKNCSSLEGFDDIKIAGPFGASATNLPFGISELTQLEHLVLPNVWRNEGSDSKKVQCLDEKLNECQWAISSLAGTVADGGRSFFFLSSSEFLEILESDSRIWERRLKNFHFYVHPLEKQNGAGDVSFHRDEYILKDISFLSRHFSHLRGQGQLLQIDGFSTFPMGIERVLSHTEYIFLLDNSFVKSLADLGSSNIKMMKGCWMQRCQYMEHVINEVEGSEELGKELEILLISNCSSLTSLYHPNLQYAGVQNLKRLYLDCCPNLSSVVSSSHWPQTLEVLQIKFCDNLATLIEGNAEELTLPNLHSLLLWELPALKSIGFIMPCLQFLEVGGCPMLEHVLSSKHKPEELKVLKVGNCEKLETLLPGSAKEAVNLPHLQMIQLWELPELTIVKIDFPSQTEFNIRECPKLQMQPVSGFGSSHNINPYDNVTRQI